MGSASTLKRIEAKPRMAPNSAAKMAIAITAIKMVLMLSYQPGETEKCQRHQTCGDHGNRSAFERNRHVGSINALTHSSKEDQHQRKAHCGTKTVNDRLDESVVFIDIEQRNAKYSTVGGNQWQEDTQQTIE